MMERTTEFTAAVGLMLRTQFGAIAKKATAVKEAQDVYTARLFKLTGGSEAQRDYLDAHSTVHTNGGVSRIWLSPRFTLPLFAIGAATLAERLMPSNGQNVFRCDLKKDETAFFGASLVSVSHDLETPSHQRFFDLCVAAATKQSLVNDACLQDFHDLLRRRVASLAA